MKGTMARFDPHRLTAARERRGLSMIELERLAGLSRGRVSEIEAGRPTTPPVVVALAAALEVSVDDLAPMPARPTLVDYRQQRGLLSQDLANELGVAAATISRIENGLLELRLREEWADLLGIDVERLQRAWEAGRRARLLLSERRLQEAKRQLRERGEI